MKKENISNVHLKKKLESIKGGAVILPVVCTCTLHMLQPQQQQDQ
jgi:hypothetical protein